MPSRARALGRASIAASLVLAPLLLFGPMLLSGQVFLPYLPAGLEPLASEHPGAAAEAMRSGNWVLGDRIFPFLTDQIAMRDELRSGHLATWQPLQGLGEPLFGATIAGGAYPPNALAYILPPERAAAPLALLSLVLAGTGLFLFLRRLGLDLRACLVGALALELGGWGLANLHYYMKVDAALWFPWAMWAVEGLARGKRWSGLALSLSLALSCLAGMVTISIFVVAGTALYALFRLGPSRPRELRSAARLRPLARAALLIALGVAGAGLQLWPLLESSRASLRQELGPDELSATALPASTTLGVVVPDLVGPPTDTTPQGDLPLAWLLTPADQHARAERANPNEWNTYALAGAALLALTGLVALPRRALFPAALLVLCFGFAQAWPLVRGLYLLPGFGLGAPGRVLALAWVLWPWLAALGVEALLARAPRALGTLLLSSTSLLLSLSVAWSRTRPEDLGPRLERVLVERYGQRFGTTVEDVRARIPAESALRAGRHLEESLARALAASAALALGGLLALFLDRRRSRFERGPPRVPLLLGGALLIGVSLLPLAAAGGPARLPQALAGLSALLLFVAIGLRTSRAELVLWLPLACALLLEGFLGARGHVGGRAILGAGLFPPSRSIDAVREAAGDGRVLRLDGSARPLERIVQLARPNLLVAYGINDLTPYPTFTPRELTELFTALDPRSFYRNHVSHLSRPELLDHPLLDLLRVQAILSYEPVVHPRLAALLERPGFCVYRRSGALPVARIVPAALAGASDEQVVRALVAAGADPARATWIAPEHAAALAGVPVPDAGADWQPGAITALERPARNRLALEIRGSRGGWLVVHEQWAEGWRARVDGGPEQPVLRADHAFRALPIPAGDLRVELSYAPRSLEWGALASALALLGVLVWELLRAPAENSGPEPG